MSEGWLCQYQELLRKAGELEDGPRKVAVLEQAFCMVETYRAVDLSFTLTHWLALAAFLGGCPDKALVAYSRCLAQLDSNTQHPWAKQILWSYRWFVLSATGFPQIARAQLEQMVADMKRRYQQAGYGMRAVFRAEAYVAKYAGELEELRRLYQLWKNAPRDEMSDDPLCEQLFVLDVALTLDQLDEALELFPSLRQETRTGEDVCCRMMTPLVRLGLLPEAAAAHRQAVAHLGKVPEREICDTARHIHFLTLTDNLARALKLFEDRLGTALRSADLWNALYFYMRAHFLLEQLQAAGRRSLRLRLPPAFPDYQESGHYETAALAAWMKNTCRDLAARFDARNSNDWHLRQIDKARQWKMWVRPFALPGSR